MSRRDPKPSQLAGLPLFAGLGRRALARAARYGTFSEAASGTALCREGTAGREVLVVMRGTAAVTVRDVLIGVVGPGDVLGALGALAGALHPATVTAFTPVTVLVLTPAELGSLVRSDPRAAVNLVSAISVNVQTARAASGVPSG